MCNCIMCYIGLLYIVNCSMCYSYSFLCWYVLSCIEMCCEYDYKIVTVCLLESIMML